MNIILKQALHGISIGIFFMLTVFGIVYAATIVNVTTQTINSGDTIGAGWYQDVNDQLSNATRIPTGAVIAFNGTTCPVGWTQADGSGDEKNTLGVNTTLDLRGEFIRGLDGGRGIDTGRSLGTFQTDAFQGHRHRSTVDSNIGAGFAGVGGRYADGNTLNWQNIFEPTSDGTNGTPRVASETRPRNIALLYCVKN